MKAPAVSELEGRVLEELSDEEYAALPEYVKLAIEAGKALVGIGIHEDAEEQLQAFSKVTEVAVQLLDTAFAELNTAIPKQFTIDDCVRYCDVIYDQIEKLECERKGLAMLAVVGLEEMLKTVSASKRLQPAAYLRGLLVGRLLAKICGQVTRGTYEDLT